MTLLPGTQVQARGTLWEVVHVEPAGEQERVRLRALAEGLRGRELDILRPFERIEPIHRDFDPARAGRLASWRLFHQAFLLDQALGSGALVATQPGRLDIAPYQLVPVMRALRMTRPRLLLADGVGLGKTIQAGFVLTELIARRRAHRILIVSPAGPLLNQWNAELRARFGLRFEVLRDQQGLQERRRSIELGANPFDDVAFCLTSVDFAKQEKVLQDLERSTWDVVVIDEAHHCVRMGQAGDREDSLRRRLAEVLARQCDGLLLLTATPHDGYDPHFASLLELLDPSLVDARGSLRGEDYRRHVIRRLKHHLKGEDGQPLFPERVVTPVPVSFAQRPCYTALQAGVLALAVPRLKSAMRRKRFGEVLAFVSLLKRAVSTASACRNTLLHVADRYAELLKDGRESGEARKQRLKTLRDYRRRLEKYGALTWEEEREQADLEAEDIAAELLTVEGVGDLIEEVEVEGRQARVDDRHTRATEQELRQLVDLAEQALPEDAKLAAVVEQVGGIRSTEPRANVLVYTEYTDSQKVVVDALKAAGIERVMVISGEDDDDARTSITERFAAEDDLVLVSTDATAEGLNLHTRCHHLVHVELPYNPNRLEQRNGRIDRYGQRIAPQVRYLYLERTFEERLLLKLVRKVEKQRQRLTFVPDTLGDVLVEEEQEERLVAGLASESPQLFLLPSNPRGEPEEDPEAYRELMAEVDRALRGFEKTGKGLAWLGEAGMNAERRLLQEASEARAEGDRQSAVALLDFVIDAVEADTGAEAARAGAVVTLRLPEAWTPGLLELPGFDRASGRLRLSADPALAQDEQGPIGYLGRAHPLVRRALDRVRNLQAGGPGALDRRVSAATWDGPATVLWTFLGTVRDARGRAFERVLAVRAAREGAHEVLTDPAGWEPLARRPVGTAGLWERCFSAWAPAREPEARAQAAAAFTQLAQAFTAEQTALLADERRELDRWLRERAEALCGPVEVQQQALFGARTELPPWKTRADPTERLAAYATDGAEPLARRREAETVLKLHRDRSADLDARRPRPVEPPVALGMLLLVPGGA